MEETIENLVTKPEGVYVDCTLGGCGHALRVIERLNEKAWFIGIDQDPTAISVAKERLAGAKCRIDIVNSNFSNLVEVLNQLKVESVDGFLFDLGVSSHQLDKAERGFSYMQDARLDMRMNPNDSLSAYEVVNKYEEENLATLILKYGEERWAKRIAKFIVAERKVKAIETTGELVGIIKKAIPAAARKEGGHPAEGTRNTPSLAWAIGGKINPQFTEWMMGFPLDFTALNQSETRKSRSKRQSRTDYSKDDLPEWLRTC